MVRATWLILTYVGIVWDFLYGIYNKDLVGSIILDREYENLSL